MAAAIFFIPFDSFNFHLPRDTFHVRFHTRSERERERKRPTSVTQDRIRGSDTKVKLSKAFCDLSDNIPL